MEISSIRPFGMLSIEDKSYQRKLQIDTVEKVANPRKTDKRHLGDAKDKSGNERKKHLVPGNISTSQDEINNSHKGSEVGDKLSSLLGRHLHICATGNTQQAAEVSEEDEIPETMILKHVPWLMLHR